LATLLQGPELGLVLPVVIIFALGQALETYVLTPYLVGERIGLHPLAVIFVLMAFAHWFGFVGMLIALPTGAVLLVVLRDLLAAWKRSTLYRGRRGKGP
jgi:predicted PurR-regulated permease PerM